MSRRAVLSFLGAVLVLYPRGATAQDGLGAAGLEGADVVDENPNTPLVKSYPFRGSTLGWEQSLGAMGLVKSADQTWNPSYSWLVRFAPRYYIDPKLSLRLKVDAGIEWTNADETTYYHQALLGDVWLDAVYGDDGRGGGGPAYRERRTGIGLTPSLRLILPTSIASQARSLYLGLSPGVAASRIFRLRHHMALRVMYSFRYTKNFNHYTTVQYEAPTIATCGTVTGGSTDQCGELVHTGVRNPSHVFTNTFNVDLAITRKLQAGMTFSIINSLLYGVTDAEVPLAGGGSVLVGTDPVNNVNHRDALLFAFEVGYEVHPTVLLSLGLSTYHPQLDESSHYRTPFLNRYTEFVLSTTVYLDEVVATIQRRMRARATLARAQ